MPLIVFVDASGFFALVVPDDAAHRLAATIWAKLRARGVALVTTSYVVAETVALLQRRRGFEPAMLFNDTVVPLVQVIWVDEALHAEAATIWRTAERRHLSFVDCVSFAAMRREGLTDALAFDPHFAEQGFRLLTAGLD